MAHATLIALDWGTTNLRASLLDANGQTVQTRSAAGGILAVQDGQFGVALRALCGDWLEQTGAALIASGMVGSRQGWQEAPYLDCPATSEQAAATLTRVAIDASGRSLHIVPGLRCRIDGAPTGAAARWDVMRGEETQIWGAGLPPGGGLCVLPGTHSKWARVEAGGRISGFRTYMTGELYALLTQHSILGRLMAFGQLREDDFATGLRLGLQAPADASHILFSVRTAGLMGQIAPEGLPDYLSGLLIGVELGSARVLAEPSQTVTLVGSDALCARYERACVLAGLSVRRAAADAGMAGLWQLARAGGLVAA